MAAQKDIFRSAHLLLKEYGPEAENIALERMEYFINIEDVTGASIWLGIANAIRNLSAEEPASRVLH